MLLPRRCRVRCRGGVGDLLRRRPVLLGGVALLQLLGLLLMLALHVGHRLGVLRLRSHLRVVLSLLLMPTQRGRI